MTAYAWLLTTWGRIRETLQPELFALRNDLRKARQERDEAMSAVIEWRAVSVHAQRAANNLSERLAQRTRELKAARAKLRGAGK